MQRTLTLALQLLTAFALVFAATACCGGGDINSAEQGYDSRIDKLDALKTKVGKKERNGIEEKVAEFKKDYAAISNDPEQRKDELLRLNSRIDRYYAEVNPDAAKPGSTVGKKSTDSMSDKSMTDKDKDKDKSMTDKDKDKDKDKKKDKDKDKKKDKDKDKDKKKNK